jgi:hypothetical protein
MESGGRDVSGSANVPGGFTGADEKGEFGPSGSRLGTFKHKFVKKELTWLHFNLKN